MEALRFEGRGLEYFKIWIVNILLVIVTLGLYYPWAKVRNKRYFYANTTLADRNFEYHATGKQLFIGYLISMVLLIAYLVIQEISPEGGLIVLGLFVLALPWIIWRSFMFDMRVTSFSNVRFGFNGQLGAAYINYLLLPIVSFAALYVLPVAVVVGIAAAGDSMTPMMILLATIVVIAFFVLALYLFSYMKKRNTSYAINSSRFGQAQFSTELETKAFVKIMLKTMGLSFLVMLAFMLFAALITYTTIGINGLLSMQASIQDPDAMKDLISGGLLMIIGPVYLGLIIASFLVLAYSYTRQRDYIYECSLLDEKIAMGSSLQARTLAWVMSTNLLLVIFTLGLALPWAKVRMARLVVENTKVDTSIGFDEYMTEKQDAQSSLGEQIGDAFDVDVGIAI